MGACVLTSRSGPGFIYKNGLTINFDFKYNVSREPCISRNYIKMYLGVMK